MAMVGVGTANVDAERAESRRRIIAALLVLYCGAQAAVGLAWDVYWHVTVGRDRFFTPPHILLYTGVALAGLICLYMVLSTTVRYRRGEPGVTDATTTPWFGVLHAPLGFEVAGLGHVALLAAAPFDNYWHMRFGVDVTLWSPFHVMGLLGAFVVAVGVAYMFISESNRARLRGAAQRRFLGLTWLDWAFCLALTGMLRQVLTLALEAMRPQYLVLADYGIALHPLLAAFGLAVVLSLAARATARTEAAAVTALLYAAINLFADAFSRLGTSRLAAAWGMRYRPASGNYVAHPWISVMVLVAGIVFWLTFRYLLTLPTRRARRATAWLPGVVAGACAALADRAWLFAASGAHGFDAGRVLMLTAIPAAAIGGLICIIGDGAGRVLRATDR